jgi:hypothetical protein
MKRLLLAMQENLGKYEKMFVTVEVGQAPHFPGALA